jgi:cold shock CspA family protein
MGRSQETSNKKDREKKKNQKKKDKEIKRQDRKSNSKKGQTLEEMFAYVDEFGRLTTTPPDKQKVRTVIASEDIEIGVPRRAAEEPEETIRKGIVTFFNDSKGFGFIRDLDSQASIFVHINSANFQIRENDKVTFEVEQGQKGPMAVRVVPTEG